MSDSFCPFYHSNEVPSDVPNMFLTRTVNLASDVFFSRERRGLYIYVLSKIVSILTGGVYFFVKYFSKHMDMDLL